MRMTRSSISLAAEYAIVQGKWLPGPQHLTQGGGNNGTGGFGAGWTGRKVIEVAPAELSGAYAHIATHSYDMQPASDNLYWGGTSGRAGAIYPGEWTQVETETILNTWNPAGGSPSDGIERVYFDGQLGSEITGFNWRNGPLTGAGGIYQPSTGTLAPWGCWLNDYQGGVSGADQARVAFITMIAVASSYIGPVQFPAPQISGGVWTPNRADNGDVLASDWANLPTGQWLNIGGTYNKLESRKPSTIYLTSGGSDAFYRSFSAWGSACWNPKDQELDHYNGGHGDSPAEEQTVYRWSAAKAQWVPNVHASPPMGNALKLSVPGDLQSALVPGNSYQGGANYPLQNGTPGMQHGWDGPLWITPFAMAAAGFAGNIKGGQYFHGNARAVLDLDTNVFSKLHYDRLFPDNSYATSFLVGTVIFTARANFSWLRWDLSQREMTDWQTSGYDSTPSVMSVGKKLTAFSAAANTPYKGRTLCRMDDRAEAVVLSDLGVQRIKVGAMAIAGAALPAHFESITLTSANGTDHLPLTNAANYQENLSGGTLYSWCNAGASWEPETQKMYLAGNVAGDPTLEISGIGASTWTVRSLGAAVLNSSTLGTYGRFQTFRQAGRTFAVRFSNVSQADQIIALTN
jgi:hypothetical protein